MKKSTCEHSMQPRFMKYPLLLIFLLSFLFTLSACDTQPPHITSSSTVPASVHQPPRQCNNHTFPDNAEVCSVCGLDYYSATLKFTLSDTGDSYIVSDIGIFTGTVLIIPASYKGLPVTEIGDEAFNGIVKKASRNFTEISLPSSITRIGDRAFSSCISLKSIRVPEGVTSIGDSAFGQCSALERISLPESLITIGSRAFSWCRSLTEIEIPKNVTTMGSGVFSTCTALTRLELHDGITTLDTASLISGCRAMETVRLPSSVTTIGVQFAYNCTALKTVELGGDILSIEKDAFSKCINLTAINLGTRLETISERAFSGCTTLSSVTLPDTVTQIGKEAFSGCTALQEMILPAKIEVLAQGVFDGCAGLVTVMLPDTTKEICANAFFSCSALRDISLPSGLEFVGANAFTGCTGLVPTAYQGMGYLGNAENPHMVLAFCIDPTVKDAVTHKNTKIIMGGALGKLDITSLTLGEHVISVPIGELVEMKSLTRIEVAPENRKYHSSGKCLIETESKTLLRGFENSIIPDDGSVTIIGAQAFAYLEGITHFVIPDSIVDIRLNAFLYCTNLEILVIGSGVQNIGASVFFGCKNLQAVFFHGTKDLWDQIDIIGKDHSHDEIIFGGNPELLNANTYFYTEEPPTSTGYYWHYIDGKPTPW